MTMAWHERGRAVTPCGSQTRSKSPAVFPGLAGPYVDDAYGARLMLVDGREVVDLLCGMGASILGYGESCLITASSTVTRQACRQAMGGVVFGLPHRLEVEVSEQFVASVPGADMVRWVKTGSEACAAAMRVARRATGRDVILTSDCYAEDTELLTERGFITFDEARLGERAVTLNMKTGLIEYQPIERIITDVYEGPMIHFKNSVVDLMVTPNHHVVRGFTQGDRRQRYDLEPASASLSRRSSVVMTQRGRWDGASAPTIELIPQNGSRRTKGVCSIPMAQFLRFLGWYLAEGFRLHTTRPRFEIHLCQNKGLLYDRMVNLIRDMGFQPHGSKRKIEFASKELWHWLESCGDGASQKRIPPVIKMLSKELLLVLLKAMMDGDGTRSKQNAWTYYTTSKFLASDVQEIALKIGWSASVRQYKNTSAFIQGKPVKNRKPIYHVYLRRRSKALHIHPKDIRSVSYHGRIVCVTVPNHVLYVRRNGRAIWSGNSSYHGWHDGFTASKPEHPGVPDAMTGLIATFRYNDLADLQRALLVHQGRVAAVMMEAALYQHPHQGFLGAVRSAAHADGALFVLDEMILGARLAWGGGQEYFGVPVDLACYGKAIAGGWPLACLVGPRSLMELADVVSGTFGGDSVALAACQATMQVYQDGTVLKRLHAHGARLQAGMAWAIKLSSLPAHLEGFAPVWRIVWEGPEADRCRALWTQTLLEKGVLAHPDVTYASVALDEHDIGRVESASIDAAYQVELALRTSDWSALKAQLIEPIKLRG